MNNNVTIKEFCEEMRKDNVAVELAKQYLISAIKKGHIGFVNLFLPIIQSNNVLYFALYQAVEKGFKDVVELLLNEGADVHANNDYALCCAATNGHKDVVELLLNEGVDVHVSNA